MVGLYIRTATKVPHPDWPDARYRDKTKRSWQRIGYICPTVGCRLVQLDDPVPDPVPDEASATV